jgi:hypothetical protein
MRAGQTRPVRHRPVRHALAEVTYAVHCAEMDSVTAPLGNRLSCADSEGAAEPGSLSDRGGNASDVDRRSAHETFSSSSLRTVEIYG